MKIKADSTLMKAVSWSTRVQENILIINEDI
jgi:hypothetical protein